MSAFTIAFQVPNLVRALFADSALQGAFVPVFTELLEKGERREAFRVASSLFFLIALVLGAVTAAFILLAEPVMSVFAPGFDDDPVLRDLTVTLAQLLFPIVRAAGALWPGGGDAQLLRPLLGSGAGARGLEPGDHRRAGGPHAGCSRRRTRSTPTPWACWRARWSSSCCHCPGCAATEAGSRFKLDWRDERVRKVLQLMLPVTIALGMINLSLLINSLVGTLVSDAGAGRDRQGVPDLPAAAGAVLDLDRHRAVSHPGAACRPRRHRRPAGDDGQRRAPDLPAADPERRADGGPGRADHPAGLPARRVRRRRPPSS